MIGVAERIEIAALADIIHLRRDRQPFVAAGEGRLPRGAGGGAFRQIVHEGGKLRLHRCPVVGVERDVDDHARPPDQRMAHGVELFKHGGPILLDPFRQPTHKEQPVDAIHLLVGPAGGGQPGTQPVAHIGRPGWNQAGLAPRLALEHDLAKAFAVVELDCEQHVAQDVEEVRRLRDGRLCRDKEARSGRRLSAHFGEIGRVPDAAGLAVDAL